MDVYLSSDSEVTFVYLSSRKRLHVRCHPALTQSLALFDGTKTVSEVASLLRIDTDYPLPARALHEFVSYLISKNIIVQKDWYLSLDLPLAYKTRLEKQLNFLMDLLDSPSATESTQKRIMNAQMAVFGLGAIGSWIVRQLVMMGFQRFILVDYDVVADADVSRHSFFAQESIGRKKIDVCREMVTDIDPVAQVHCLPLALDVATRVADIADTADFIVNAADEPYIGYTSLKLSRYCVATKKPLFVAGGFDAHLGSLGELILPRKTPCADCYDQYFKSALRDWKPIPHPVINRERDFGGLVSMTGFSSSCALLTILRYFINPSDSLNKGGRGEFLFDTYSIDRFDVERDPNCKVCGEQGNAI